LLLNKSNYHFHTPLLFVTLGKTVDAPTKSRKKKVVFNRSVLSVISPNQISFALRSTKGYSLLENIPNLSISGLIGGRDDSLNIE